MYQDLIISGFGGQGVLVIGRLLSYAAMRENKYVTFLPSYGPIMRGGTAHCTVVISSRPIGSPIIHKPLSAILMNVPSVLKFEGKVKPGGLVLYNSDLVDRTMSKRGNMEKVFVPATTIAQKVGSDRVANMVLAGAFIERTKVVSFDSASASILEAVGERHRDFVHLDEEALRMGVEFVRSGMSAGLKKN